MTSVLLTRRLPSAVISKLETGALVDLYAGEASIPPAELCARLADKDALICLLTDAIDKRVIDAGPNLKIIAPWREWTMRSRRELIEYAERHGIPITATKAKPYSMDLNLFHISYEGGILEDPWSAPPDEIFQMTVSPEQAPNKPLEVEIEYVAGNSTDTLAKLQAEGWEIVSSDPGSDRRWARVYLRRALKGN